MAPTPWTLRFRCSPEASYPVTITEITAAPRYTAHVTIDGREIMAGGSDDLVQPKTPEGAVARLSDHVACFFRRDVDVCSPTTDAQGVLDRLETVERKLDALLALLQTKEDERGA